MKVNTRRQRVGGGGVEGTNRDTQEGESHVCLPGKWKAGLVGKVHRIRRIPLDRTSGE